MSKDITIEIGTFETVGDLRKALEESGVKIDYLAKSLINKVKILGGPKKTLCLGIYSVRELSVEGRPVLGNIYSTAKERGLSLCPAEVGPQLRLQYLHQPNCEWLEIAMLPIKSELGIGSVFQVGCNGIAFWLQARYANAITYYAPEEQFVFVRR